MAVRVFAIGPILLIGLLLLVVGLALLASARTRGAGAALLGLLVIAVLFAVGVGTLSFVGFRSTAAHRAQSVADAEAHQRAMSEQARRESMSQPGRTMIVPNSGVEVLPAPPAGKPVPTEGATLDGLWQQAELANTRAKALIASAEELVSQAKSGITASEQTLAQAARSSDDKPADEGQNAKQEKAAANLAETKSAVTAAEEQIALAKAAISWIDGLLARAADKSLSAELPVAELPAEAGESHAVLAAAAVKADTAADTSRRPAWVEAKPDLRNGAYEMSVSVGPYTSRLECDAHLPAAVDAAVDEIVATYLGSEWSGRVHLPTATVRQNVVRETYEEKIQSYFGPTLQSQPMVQLHAHLVFDRKTMDQLRDARNQCIVAERLRYAGIGLAGLLLGLTVIFAGLKTDVVTRGAYRKRLALVTVALFALVAVGAGTAMSMLHQFRW